MPGRYCGSMKHETAAAIAAGTVGHLNSNDVNDIVRNYLKRRTECPFCEGDGAFKVPSGKDIEIDGQKTEGGMDANCPLCANSGLDHDFARWDCQLRENAETCDHHPRLDDELEGNHSMCGWVIPLAALPMARTNDDEDDAQS